MSTLRGSAFARDMLMGAGVVVMLALAWAAVTRVPEWLDATVQQAVQEALQETRSAAAVESEAVQGFTEVEVQRAVDDAVRETRQLLREVFGRERELRGLLSGEVAERVVRFNISQMTRRWSMSAIEPRKRLEEVDINSDLRLDRFRTRLGASVRATFEICISEQPFQNVLRRLSTRTSVQDTAESLIAAIVDGRCRG